MRKIKTIMKGIVVCDIISKNYCSICISSSWIPTFLFISIFPQDNSAIFFFLPKTEKSVEDSHFSFQAASHSIDGPSTVWR
jgi:hypothetical protein